LNQPKSVTFQKTKKNWNYYYYYYYYYYLFLTAIVLTPGGSSAVGYTFTNKPYTEYRERNIHKNKKKKFEKCGPCPVFASYNLAFALQLRKKHGKPLTEEKARKNLNFSNSKRSNTHSACICKLST
jgi:hypothetical protein